MALFDQAKWSGAHSLSRGQSVKYKSGHIRDTLYQLKKMSPLVALSAILVIGCAVSSNANQGYIANKLITLQYRQKRALPLLLIAEKSGGKGEGKPPPELETLMNTPVNTGNLIDASMSGPLVVIGGILILLSLAMAISYQQVSFIIYDRPFEISSLGN